MHHKNMKNGFTLVEVLIAVIFIGLAMAALLAGNGAFTQANAAANELSTAEFLTEQVRERLTLLSFATLNSFNNANYQPPKDAKGDDLPENLAAYSQKITVENVSPTNFTQAITYNSSNNFIRITVDIYLGTNKISSANWIRAKY